MRRGLVITLVVNAAPSCLPGGRSQVPGRPRAPAHPRDPTVLTLAPVGEWAIFLTRVGGHWVTPQHSWDPPVVLGGRRGQNPRGCSLAGGWHQTCSPPAGRRAHWRHAWRRRALGRLASPRGRRVLRPRDLGRRE
jgi:hypothetical protein